MRIIHGDITTIDTNTPTLIPHICNDQRQWGAGFTGAISAKWPQVEQQYRAMKEYKLGTIQIVDVTENLAVINMIAQSGTIRKPVGRLPPIRYGALAIAMHRVLKIARDRNATIKCPRFGTGLAGGRPDVIESMMNEIWVDNQLEVQIYQLD